MHLIDHLYEDLATPKESECSSAKANQENETREGHFYFSEQEGSTHPIDIIVRQAGRQ